MLSQPSGSANVPTKARHYTGRASSNVQVFEPRTIPEGAAAERVRGCPSGAIRSARRGIVEALSALRHHIRRYNDATGIGNTSTSGYHETITRFYVFQLYAYVMRTATPRNPVQLLHGLAAEPMSQKDFVLRHYSRERLMSGKARREWVAPDAMNPEESRASG